MPVTSVVFYKDDDGQAAILASGIIKEREVPPQEIDRAIERKRRFEEDPAKHTYSED